MILDLVFPSDDSDGFVCFSKWINKTALHLTFLIESQIPIFLCVFQPNIPLISAAPWQIRILSSTWVSITSSIAISHNFLVKITPNYFIEYYLPKPYPGKDFFPSYAFWCHLQNLIINKKIPDVET